MMIWMLVQILHCFRSNLLQFKKQSEMKIGCKPWMKKLKLLKIMIHGIWLISQRKTNLIGVKWVYKTKLNEKGEIDRFKDRLVEKGFSQQLGIDFGETFSPVARLDTVRAVLATKTQNKWKLYQMDVKSTFVNGILEEEIYMQQPP